MKRVLVAIVILLFAAGLTGSSYAQDKNTAKNSSTQEATAEVKEYKGDAKAVNSVCPVSEEEIDDPVKIEYKGKIYAVCCKSCLKKIKKDPEKYISKLSEDGKTLKKKS